jgi:hypothetical protein
MKKVFTLKKLLFATAICAAGAANGQLHPLSYGTMGGAYTNSNWFKDYVGVRLEVCSPPPVAGDKVYTTANDGTGKTGVWGSAVTAVIPCTQVVMPQAGDSLAGTAITTSMTGKIALIYRGGGIEFVCKAFAAQNAGAIACVIVNNVPGGPVGMGAGTVCDSKLIKIPVFMISKADGDALDAQYWLSPTSVNMSITPWGQGLSHDLGFVPGGAAAWHAFAVPSDQLSGTGVVPYKGLDGAFIANYGTSTESNVKVSGTLSFTPTGSTTATQVHTDTVSLPSFPVADSVWAMFDTLTSNNEYDVTATGTGRFDLTYHITQTATDNFPGDNTTSVSFYSTDSLYSKGRYDFTAKQPIRTDYRGGSTSPVMWGDMFYVNKGGSAISNIQYSLYGPAAGPFSETSNNVYVFTWVDGSGDGIMQDGELNLIATGNKDLTGPADTSGALLELKNIKTDAGRFVSLQPSTWYYVAVGMPAGYFLGMDENQYPYPRIFGRAYAVNNYFDYSNLEFVGGPTDLATDPTINNNFMPGSGISHLAVDSFNYHSVMPLLPAIAIIVNKDTTSIPVDTINAVNNVTKPAIGITLYPNPAADYITVSVELDKFASSVKYTLLDGLGRIVSETTHANLQSEKYTINTAALASGNYFLVVNANNKVTFKKFVVASR